MGRQRLALLAFAGAFVLLFVCFAVAQGIGHSSVPSGDVAIVEDAPGDTGTITEAAFQHRLVQTAASAQVKPVPKPGDKQYEELMTTALGEMLDSIWLQGQAAEMGISVTPKEISDELEKVKQQSFKTEAQYKAFLKEAHFTQADVDERVKLQILSTKIQAQVNESAPTPSSGEIEEYYEAAKATQFTLPETREVRTVVNKDKGKVEEAKAKLEEDNSPASWKRVAKRYSTDPTTKGKGGLSTGLAKGASPEPLDAAYFKAPTGQIEGPLKGPSGYVVFEVVKATPEKVQSLEEAKPQISSQLSEKGSQRALARFIRNYSSTWQSRTFCASGFTIERCANFKDDGRPAEANPACYEANPKTPPEACPAPVTQVKPALPGTVEVLTPEGQKLAQRPRPAGLEESAAAVAPPPLGVPPTAAPGG